MSVYKIFRFILLLDWYSVTRSGSRQNRSQQCGYSRRETFLSETVGYFQRNTLPASGTHFGGNYFI